MVPFFESGGSLLLLDCKIQDSTSRDRLWTMHAIEPLYVREEEVKSKTKLKEDVEKEYR